MGLKSSRSITPVAALSWFPRTKTLPSARDRSGTSFGLAPYPTMSPRFTTMSNEGAFAEPGVESFEIGVNVAEKQYAHESPDKLPIIDQLGAKMVSRMAARGGRNRVRTGKTRMAV